MVPTRTIEARTELLRPASVVSQDPWDIESHGSAGFVHRDEDKEFAGRQVAWRRSLMHVPSSRTHYERAGEGQEQMGDGLRVTPRMQADKTDCNPETEGVTYTCGTSGGRPDCGDRTRAGEKHRRSRTRADSGVAKVPSAGAPRSVLTQTPTSCQVCRIRMSRRVQQGLETLSQR